VEEVERLVAREGEPQDLNAVWRQQHASAPSPAWRASRTRRGGVYMNVRVYCRDVGAVVALSVRLASQRSVHRLLLHRRLLGVTTHEERDTHAVVDDKA
jgi:hypothetical protein